MNKLLFASIILMSTSLISLSQNEKSRSSIPLMEKKANDNLFPSLDQFKGDFQIQLLKYEKVALTSDFFDFIESKRKDNERVELRLSADKILIIAGRNEIMSDGSGPFKEAFIIKD